jgi:hypothetical protein
MGARDPWWPLVWGGTADRPTASFEAPNGRVFKIKHHIGEGRYEVAEHPSMFRNADREFNAPSIMELRALLIWAITGPGNPDKPKEAPPDAAP